LKGDKVEVVVDVGDGTRSFFVEAQAAGRSVQVRQGAGNERSLLLVELVGKTGKVVKTDRFALGRVVALIEERADKPDDTQEALL
jgi:hypothetical protein